ncbi:MAG: mechanosensitive ion channel family protein, partial [Pseudomonadota bacterium]
PEPPAAAPPAPEPPPPKPAPPEPSPPKPEEPRAAEPAAPQPAAPASPPAPSAAPERAPSSAAAPPSGPPAGPATLSVPSAPRGGAPSAPPAASAPRAPKAAPSADPAEVTGVQVRLGDSPVFVLRATRAQRSPAERARRAERALAAAVNDPNASEVKVVREGETAVVYAGSNPIVQLGPEDAQLAGDSSLDAHAGAVAAAVREALDAERRRSKIAQQVFSGSLVVFFALIAFYLVRKLGEVAEKVRAWLEENGDRVLTIRIQSIELARPAMLKSAAIIGLGLVKWLGQLGIVYAWLVIVLSLFAATRGYTERLTGFLLEPLSQLMSRIATALPLVVVAGIAGLAVFVLVRFVGLFLAGVARHESQVAWLPPDLAAPTSVIVRVGIVVSALVFAAPVVTGDPDGAFGRAGLVALVSVGLAGTPLLATGLVGTIVVFGRRLRVGDHVEIGGSTGRILALNLLELRLETPEHTEVRVPHLTLLGRTLRTLGRRPRISVELAVSPTPAPRTVQLVLEEAALRIGRDVRVELLAFDAEGALYRASVTCEGLEARTKLATVLMEALAAAGIPLGRTPPMRAP